MLIRLCLGEKIQFLEQFGGIIQIQTSSWSLLLCKGVEDQDGHQGMRLPQTLPGMPRDVTGSPRGGWFPSLMLARRLLLSRGVLALL